MNMQQWVYGRLSLGEGRGDNEKYLTSIAENSYFGKNNIQ